MSRNEENIEKDKDKPSVKIENNPTEKKIVNNPIIKKDELLKFVYDLSSQNLNASSFKYAMRNLKNDQFEKEEYLLVYIFLILRK
jgi:hypothetical protein